jgi:single-stranded DNA-binding protein
MFSARTFLKATRPMARSFSAQPARQIAKITLVGRLPHDAELSQTSAGREFVRYAVGNTIKKANGEEKTSWFRVSAFGDRSKEYTLSLKKGYVGG